MKNEKAGLSGLILHPFFFAIYPVLYLYTHNIEQIAISETFAPLTSFFVISLVLWGLIRLLVRDGIKTSLILTLSLVLFFSYGHLYNYVLSQDAIADFARHRIFLIATSGIWFFGVLFILISKRTLAGFNRFLNLLAIILIVFSAGPISADIIRGIKAGDSPHKTTRVDEKQLTTAADQESMPNIYYIILDGYAHHKILKENYDYDNSKFIGFLKDKDFYIVENSRSNYAHTQMSLSSSLNMEHVIYMEELFGRHSTDVKMLVRNQENNRIVRFLKAQGYKFVHFSRGFGTGNRNLFSDVEIQCGNYPVFFGGSEFVMHLIQTSMLLPFEHLLVGDDLRDRTNCTFEELTQLYKFDFPFFSFSHVLPPHPPYVFGPNGEAIENSDLKLIDAKGFEPQQYLDQVTYVTDQITGVVADITKNDKTAVIIIQSDHGAAFTGPWEAPTTDFLIERFSILNAIRAPESCGDHFYSTMTPVNSFGMLFNCLFDADFEKLEDRSFFSKSWEPYAFVEVTDQVQNKGAES